MSNSYGQESISKPCLLCGLPMAKTGKSYHPHCKKRVAAWRVAAKRADGIAQTEVEYRWGEVKAHVEWLLSQPNKRVKPVVGEKGENALIAFRVYMRREI